LTKKLAKSAVYELDSLAMPVAVTALASVSEANWVGMAITFNTLFGKVLPC